MAAPQSGGEAPVLGDTWIPVKQPAGVGGTGVAPTQRLKKDTKNIKCSNTVGHVICLFHEDVTNENSLSLYSKLKN